MNTISLSRDIEELYLELMLASGNEADSLSVALAKLGTVVETANRIGNQVVAANTSRLLASIAVVRESEPGTDALPLLLEGLKSLETAVHEPASGQIDSAVPSSSGSGSSLSEDPELLGDFVLEAREHLSVVEAQLLVLEQNPLDSEPTHACFRAIHTIKGIAGFLDLHAIREVSHEAETLLDKLRNGLLQVRPALIDVLLKSSDFIRQEVSAVEDLLAGKSRAPQSDFQPLLKSLRDCTEQSDSEAESTPAEAPTAEAAPAETETAALVPAEAMQSQPSLPDVPEQNIFILPAVAAQAEPQTKPAAAAVIPAAVQKKPTAPAKTQAISRSVKVDMEKLDYLADMVGELVVTQSMLNPQNGSGNTGDSPLARNLAQLGRITAEVQKTAMSMRMVPIGQTFQRLSRLVRDVSRQAGKNIELEVSGEEIELDRSMVEELADPLMHMVRNSIDHGIEDAEQRRKSRKNPVGRIYLQARHDAGQVEIQISDDGRGLNRERILEKARQKGLVDPNANLTDSEIYNLIFEPGFSTAEKVSDLSGRGVGMDVVRKQIQKLRGRVELRSIPGQGTTFLLRLPLTLAIIDGLVVGLGANRYIVPVPAVREIIHPTAEMLFTVEGRCEMVMVRDRMLPLTRLCRWLNFGDPAVTDANGAGVLIVMDTQTKTFCLAVDKVIGKQEVVIKSLGEYLQDVPGVAGGAILGDGRVGLILDIDTIAGRPCDV